MASSRLIAAAAVLALAGCRAETDAEVISREAAPPAPDPVATAAAGVPSESRRFRDWLAVCDNGNACHAFGPAENDNGFVRIAIQPGPDARPGVTVGLWPPEASGVRVLTLRVDGRVFETTSAQAEAVAGDPPIGVVQGEAAELVQAMGQGRSMTIEHLGQATPVSLSGAAAAFLWIDERQGRLDTPTALIRRGDRPAGAVPPAPPLPRPPVGPAIGQAGLPETPVLSDALAADDGVRECLAETAHMQAEYNHPTVARLADGVELWGVPCFFGAYNMGARYWLTGAEGRDPRPVEFPTASGEMVSDLVNSGYDPETRVMTAFNKGRGLGDCGVAQTWVWTGQVFALTRETEMSECWGAGPDLWPTTWRSAGRGGE